MGKEQSAKSRPGQIIPFIRDGEYYYKKGIKAYRHHDLGKAQKYIQRAVQLNPDEAVYLCQLAAIETELGNFTVSNQLLLKVIEEVDPDMGECYYFLANNYAHLGLFQEAEKYADQYLQLDPDGEFYDETLDLIELLSIEKDENEPAFHMEDSLIIKQEKAKELLEQGQFHAAIAALEELVEEYPEFWSAYNNLSLAYFYSGNNDAALETVREVFNRNPGNLHAMCNLAVFSYYMDDDETADRMIAQLKTVYPIDFDQRFKLGATFALTGHYEEANKWLRWLYRHGFEGDGSFYYWLSLSAFYTGNRQFAQHIWNKLAEMNPDKKDMEPWNQNQEVKLEERLKTASLDDLRHDFAFRSSLIQTLQSKVDLSAKLYALFLLEKLGDDEASEALKTYEEMTEEPIAAREFATSLLAKIWSQQNTQKSGHVLTFATAESGSHSVKAPMMTRTNLGAGYKGSQISDLISRKAGQNKTFDKLHELYTIWFHVFSRIIRDGIAVKNEYAWAAAVEYVWKKANKEKITQSQLAEKYDISNATIGKYVKFVKSMLT